MSLYVASYFPMRIFGGDANRQQGGQQKAASETWSLGNPEWAKHWWKHCILWHHSCSAPGSQEGKTLASYRGFSYQGLFSFLALSLDHSKLFHVWCQPKISHFISYIKYNLSLFYEEFSTTLSCSAQIFPFFLFQNPSNYPSHCVWLPLMPHAALRDSLCCSATLRSFWVEGCPVASFTPGDIPSLKTFFSQHQLSRLAFQTLAAAA